MSKMFENNLRLKCSYEVSWTSFFIKHASAPEVDIEPFAALLLKFLTFLKNEFEVNILSYHLNCICNTF